MSVTTEPGSLGPQTALFEHALRLHQQDSDSPLPRDGEPYPDGDLHRFRRQRTQTRKDQRRHGVDVAAILDKHFGKADAAPSELVDAFCKANVPIHPNVHIAAAARRAHRQRIRQTGRWLVRHSPDRCSATVGLALLATDSAEEDIPLIQTIGLLSRWFGPLAAEALRRRRGGEHALLWLAQRVAGWGRVYVIETLCQQGAYASRRWLLRRACDGDFLNGYFAGRVATTAHLHEAITGTETDDDLVDHTGRLLKIMTESSGMGMTLEHYPPAPHVLAAHVARLGRQTPTPTRYVDAASIADHLADKTPQRSGCTNEQRDHLVRQYLAVLDRQDWCDAVRAGIDADNDFFAWFASNPAARLHLRAFTEMTGDDR